MRVISLGSSSSGNALLVEAGPQGRTKLLVDAGFTGQVLIERLRAVGISAAQLRGILVTHEHTDHILALPALIKRYNIPVIADPRTLEAIEQIFVNGALRTEFEGTRKGLPVWGTGNPYHDTVSTVEAEVARMQAGEACLSSCLSEASHGSVVWEDGGGGTDKNSVAPGGGTRSGWDNDSSSLVIGSRCMIGDIEVVSFPVSHDAVAPCGYLLSAGGCRVCVAIDSGEVTATMLEAMHQADLLILESNHDREKLLRGPYPYSLKQRILSATGHLSNDQAAEAVLRTWRSDGVRWLWLSHLSRTNNTPKLALNTMRTRIQAAKAKLAQVHISILPPGMGGIWDSTQLWHSSSLWEMQI